MNDFKISEVRINYFQNFFKKVLSITLIYLSFIADISVMLFILFLNLIIAFKFYQFIPDIFRYIN